MNVLRTTLLSLTLCAGIVPAQRIWLASEFQRVTPNGTFLDLDRVERPREIISPAVARNSHASFRVVVEMPPGRPYTLFCAQNPDHTVTYRMYQENYTRAGDSWIADELQLLDMPHSAKLSPEQKVQTYLLDLWVPADAPVERLRFEVQMDDGERWVVYPMEVRITAPVAKEPMGFPTRLPAAAERADQSAAAAARVLLCGQRSTPPPANITNLRQLMARNALRDLTLIETKDRTSEILTQALGYENLDSFCRATLPPPRGAEAWLRLRDHLYQGRPLP